MLRAFDRAILLATSVVVAGLMALMAGVVLAGVFSRYVLGDALSWSEELARYTMLWLSWLGGGLALRRGAHIATDLVVNLLDERVRRAVLFLGQVLVLGFLCLVAYYGYQLVGRVAFQTTAALGVTMRVPYAAVPVGSVLMMYHLLIVMFVPGLDVKRDTELQA